jgi:hypothetical protein
VCLCHKTVNFLFRPSTFDDVGRGDEESAGEEYEAGEYVLEDLELGSPEKAGNLIYLFFHLSVLVACFL